MPTMKVKTVTKKVAVLDDAILNATELIGLLDIALLDDDWDLLYGEMGYITKYTLADLIDAAVTGSSTYRVKPDRSGVIFHVGNVIGRHPDGCEIRNYRVETSIVDRDSIKLTVEHNYHGDYGIETDTWSGIIDNETLFNLDLLDFEGTDEEWEDVEDY